MTGSPSIAWKMPTKSSRWIGSSFASARSRPARVVGEDHLAHRVDAVALEEHVLGAAEADALGAELARDLARRRGVSALARTFRRADLVGPAHQRRELAGSSSGVDRRHLAEDTPRRSCRRA